MPEPFLISVTVVTVAYFAYKALQITMKAPAQVIEQVGKTTEDLIKLACSELKSLFGAEPSVTLDRTVKVGAPKTICEFALTKQIVEVTENWEHTRFFSTKKLWVSQQFVVKAGFDLNRITLEFSKGKREVSFVITDPIIVNVEPIPCTYRTIRRENGLWNNIATQESDRITNLLPEKAKAEVNKEQLANLAVEHVKAIFGAFFGKLGVSIVVHYNSRNLIFDADRPLPDIPSNTLERIGLSLEKKAVQVGDRPQG